MANGTIWMHSVKGGYHPCYDENDAASLEKSGWTRCGCKPSQHKAQGQCNQKFAVVAAHEVPAIKEELSKEDLIELANDSGVEIDKRWSVARIKEAIGL